jgi:uncharacterized membrane protein
MNKDHILKKIHPAFYVSVIFSIFTFIFGIILSNGLVIFLSWNIALAILVYVLSFIVYLYHQKQAYKYIPWIGSILWILFFPNSFYLLTDTIHFQNYDFFQMYPSIYQLEIYDWYVFFIVTVAMMLGVKLGLLSIANIKKMIPAKYQKYEYLGLGILFLLSSIAIYLGRFIRLNSWNILDVRSIISGIFDHFGFFMMFIILFTIIHGIIYLLFKEKEIE